MDVQERRRGPDGWVKAARIMGMASTFLLIALILIIAFAKPHQADFISRFAKVQVFGYWDEDLLRIAFIAVIVMAVISLCGLFINSRRKRRKNDKYRFSLVMSLIVSIISTVLFSIYFL